MFILGRFFPALRIFRFPGETAPCDPLSDTAAHCISTVFEIRAT